MDSLRQACEGWAEVSAEELRLLRRMTAEESLRQFLALQSEFAGWLEETKPLYRAERNEAMIALQSRLGRINDLLRTEKP